MPACSPKQDENPNAVEENTEVIVHKPISTGHFSYPRQHGYQNLW
jgi:hypothetical protein